LGFEFLKRPNEVENLKKKIFSLSCMNLKIEVWRWVMLQWRKRDGEEASKFSAILGARVHILSHQAKPQIFKILTQNPNSFR